MKKFINTALLLGLIVFVIGTINVLAGTASASATASNAGGEDCGKISKKKGQNTGAMTVGTVTVNGGPPLTLGTDYVVENNGSTRPVIKFTSPLPANANVNVTLSTKLGGRFDVILTLTKC